MKKFSTLNIFFLLLLILTNFLFLISSLNLRKTHISPENNLEIEYNDLVVNIINKFSTQELKHDSYSRTAYLQDTFGSRMIGSPSLEESIEFMKAQLIKEGFENVRKEVVPNLPSWVRGKESLTLLSPRKYPVSIPVIGLGRTVPCDLTAEVFMVKSFEELESYGKNNPKIKDKILFLNPEWTNYHDMFNFRSLCAIKAAEYGSSACFLRSLTPDLIGFPHTGSFLYDPNVKKIPAAAISFQDAKLFERIINRGQRLELHLILESHYTEKRNSYNLIGEIIGREKPEEIILMGGHIDSWDVGAETGSNDDAAGFMICFSAMRALIRLNLRPRRTLRFIAWTAEEMGDENRGSLIYDKEHKYELKNHILAFESDEGMFELQGWGYNGNKGLKKKIEEINQTFLVKKGIIKSHKNIISDDANNNDVEELYTQNNIPIMKNLLEKSEDNKEYYYIHHSLGDSIAALNPDDMDQNATALAIMFYIIADLKEIPKK
jgi:carboxypeptidase Q